MVSAVAVQSRLCPASRELLWACSTVSRDVFRKSKAKSTMKLSGEMVVPTIGPAGVFRAVEDVAHNENPAYLNSWVCEV